jgi:HAD superfamily hydrolase (TIGR01662 family)
LEDNLLSPNGLRGILFDLDGTLRHSRPSFIEAFIDFAVGLGLADSLENRKRANRWLYQYWADSAEMLRDRKSYGVRDDLFWTNHARLGLMAFGCPPKLAESLAPQLYSLMEEAYQPEDWIPSDVPETLNILKEAGFSLGVASNRTRPYVELLESLGLEAYFEFALAAGEVNIWKPKPGIFLHALERLGTSVKETLYVGDNYYADVLGARGVGLKAILIDPGNIFPKADCPVIQTLGELPELLSK